MGSILKLHTISGVIGLAIITTILNNYREYLLAGSLSLKEICALPEPTQILMAFNVELEHTKG